MFVCVCASHTQLPVFNCFFNSTNRIVDLHTYLILSFVTQQALWSGVNRSAIVCNLHERHEKRQKSLFEQLTQALATWPSGVRIRLNATFDEWSCNSMKSWVTITVTWVDPATGKLQRRIVRLKSFPSNIDKITAIVLKYNLVETFRPLQAIAGSDEAESLLPSLFQAFTTDTAAVPLAVSNNFPRLRTKCMCHIIHLIFGDVLSPTKLPDEHDDEVADNGPHEHAASAQLGSQSLQDILKVCKALLSKFSVSSKNRRNYEVVAKRLFPDELILMPIYDVPTRWSSSIHLILRVMEIWTILKAMTAAQLSYKVCDTYKWTDLKEALAVYMLQLGDVVDLLRPFLQYTTFFQTTSITSSFVCMAATELYTATRRSAEALTSSALVKDIANALCASTTKRLGEYVNMDPGDAQPNGQLRNSLASLAQLADPRTWKAATAQSFADGEVRSSHKYSAKQRLLFGDGGRNRGLIDLAADAICIAVSSEDVVADDLQVPAFGGSAHLKQQLTSEIVAYVRAVAANEIPSNKNSDVLQLISSPDYKNKYPMWAALQMSLLSISASSAESERVFSLAALVKTKLRNRLSESMLELLVLLNADTRQREPAVGVFPSPDASTRRVETAKRMANGMPRRQAIAEARAASAPQLGNNEAAASSTTIPAVVGGSDDVNDDVDDDDDDDDDEGPLMEAMLAAGCRVDDAGSLVVDNIKCVLESDFATGTNVPGPRWHCFPVHELANHSASYIGLVLHARRDRRRRRDRHARGF